MDDRVLAALDPELLAVASSVPGFDVAEPELPAMRAAMAASFQNSVVDDGRVVLRREVISSPDDGHSISLLIYEPADDRPRRGAVLDIHGGGYIFGMALMNDSQNRRIAAELSAVVVSVDYRLAPEYKYPYALRDCLAAATWLQANAEIFSVPSRSIVVLGTSAGGGLAAALTLYLRDQSISIFCGQVLLSPMLDARTSLQPLHPVIGRVGWSLSNNRFGWESYLGKTSGAADVPVYAAPGRADDLSGLPPSFVSVGSVDLFVHETLDYVRRLAAAGVSVDFSLYAGAFHGFARFAPGAGVTHRSTRDCLAAIDRFFR